MEIRISFVEDATKKLFEERVKGNMPDGIFKKLLSDYEAELSELEARHATISRTVQEKADNEQNIAIWVDLVKECMTISELNRATAYQLIESIAVHERAKQDGATSQDVEVKYRFVGRIA